MEITNGTCVIAKGVDPRYPKSRQGDPFSVGPRVRELYIITVPGRTTRPCAIMLVHVENDGAIALLVRDLNAAPAAGPAFGMVSCAADDDGSLFLMDTLGDHAGDQRIVVHRSGCRGMFSVRHTGPPRVVDVSLLDDLAKITSSGDRAAGYQREDRRRDRSSAAGST